jgi:hypothetical protein
MNATTLSTQNWATELQRQANQVIFYTPIVWKAFNKAIKPCAINAAKGLALHWFESECYWRRCLQHSAGVTHNPITAAVKSAITELTSVEARATYSRIRHIVREAATDALVVGLCGVIAIASGIELAQKIYRQAKAAYAWVDAKLNPASPEPIILPTVEMALDEISILTAEDEAIERDFLERLGRIEPSIQALGPIANPEPKDIHQEVCDRLVEIQGVDAPNRRRKGKGAAK